MPSHVHTKPKDRDILSCECSCLVRHNDVQIKPENTHTHIHTTRQADSDLLSCARQCTRKKNPAPLSLPLSLSLSLYYSSRLTLLSSLSLARRASPPPESRLVVSFRSRHVPTFPRVPFLLSIFHHSLIINKLKIQNEINSLLVTKKS